MGPQSLMLVILLWEFNEYIFLWGEGESWPSSSPPPFPSSRSAHYHDDDLSIIHQNSSGYFIVCKNLLLSETHQQHHRQIQFEECKGYPSTSRRKRGEKLHLYLNKRRGSRRQENSWEDKENTSMEAVLL